MPLSHPTLARLELPMADGPRSGGRHWPPSFWAPPFEGSVRALAPETPWQATSGNLCKVRSGSRSQLDGPPRQTALGRKGVPGYDAASSSRPEHSVPDALRRECQSRLHATVPGKSEKSCCFGTPADMLKALVPTLHAASFEPGAQCCAP